MLFRSTLALRLGVRHDVSAAKSDAAVGAVEGGMVAPVREPAVTAR